MVENNTSRQISMNTVSLPYTVEEQFLAAKTSVETDCEDAIYIGSHFVAVIDGATSKTPRRWDGQTGGRIAAMVIQDAFALLSSEATAREAVDQLTIALQQLYERYHVVEIMQDDPVQRAVASFIAVSFSRREVWLVGDCQCLLNQEHIVNTKEVDRVTSLARSLFLEAEIVQGKSLEQLRQDDTGRAFILPLLERQMIFQNNPDAGQYWFPVLDGFHVPDEGIRVLSLPEDITTIVLASDGYPILKETLAASEQVLQDLLVEDPLLFRKYLSTKGVASGNNSYDDRAYVKIHVAKSLATAGNDTWDAERQLAIRLELEPEYDSEIDQAIVGEVGRDTLVILRQEAYTVQPVDTHTRGGEFVVDLLKVAWDHRATIEHAVTDLSSLVTILGVGAVPAMQSVLGAYTKRATPGSAPIKFTLDIDGATIQVEVSDLQQTEAVLQIARKFQSSHPHVARQVSSKSQTKVNGKLPKQQRRGRR